MVITTFSKIIEGEQSLFRWIKENSTEGKLSNEMQNELPDTESKHLSFPTLENINFVAGMLDGVISKETESAKQTAQKLFDLMESFLDDNGEDIDIKLGRAYGFLIEHSTISYIDSFLELLVKAEDNSHESFIPLCYKIAFIFATEGFHREAVKFGIAIIGIFTLTKEDIDILMTFGLADEFSKFVAVALEREEYNEKLFELAQKTEGWGRINYIERLLPLSNEIKSWLIYEGYKCDIGINHVALECVIKGNLLQQVKKNGWNKKLYDATNDLLNGLIDDGPTEGIDGYNDSKEVLELFIEESRHQEATLDNFYKLCNIFFYIRDNYENEGWSNEQKELLVQKIGDTAWRRWIDWQSIIFEDVTDYRARIVAKAMGIDIWDKLFEIAQKDDEFDEWFALTQTDDIKRYRQLCIVAQKKLPLQEIATGPKDELGLGHEFRPHMHLLTIIQRLDSFDEIMGVELIKTALNSPVTNNRNMALRIIKSWQAVPNEVIEILKKNRSTEPHAKALENYDAILNRT